MVESRQGEVLSIIGVFVVLAYIFIGMRLYSRYLGRNFGWDDYLIIFSAFCFLGQTIATWQWILLSGTGFHKWDLPKKSPHEQVIANQWSLAIQIIYHPLMGAIRASIILFLFRMKDYRKRIQYSLHIVFWLNVLYAVATLLGNILQCTPVQYTWAKPAMDHVDASGKLVQGGKCIDSRAFLLASCGLSIAMDLVIIPIPSIMVWNLQMQIKTKVLVVIVMSLGWVATGVSIARFIVYYYRFAPSNVDRTWNIGIAISIVEPAVHIISACAPATKSLFRFLFPNFSNSRTRATYEERQSTQTPRLTRFGSRGSKFSKGSFRFGFSDGGTRAEQIEEDCVIPRPTANNTESGSDYGLSRLKSKDSRTNVDSYMMVEEESKRSAEMQDFAQTSSTKTASVHETEAAEPKHILAHVN